MTAFYYPSQQQQPTLLFQPPQHQQQSRQTLPFLPTIPHNQTKITATALENRRRFFIDKLKRTSLFLLQSILLSVFTPRSSSSVKINEEKKNAALEIRELSRKAKENNELFNQFYVMVSKEFPHLSELLEMAVVSYLEVMQLTAVAVKNSDGTHISEPIRHIWLFLLRVIYEKPKIVLDQQDIGASNLETVKNAWPEFIAEITPINFDILFKTPRLTVDVLRQHDLQQQQQPSPYFVPQPIVHLPTNHATASSSPPQAPIGFQSFSSSPTPPKTTTTSQPINDNGEMSVVEEEDLISSEEENTKATTTTFSKLRPEMKRVVTSNPISSQPKKVAGSIQQPPIKMQPVSSSSSPLSMPPASTTGDKKKSNETLRVYL